MIGATPITLFCHYELQLCSWVRSQWPHWNIFTNSMDTRISSWEWLR